MRIVLVVEQHGIGLAHIITLVAAGNGKNVKMNGGLTHVSCHPN